MKGIDHSVLTMHDIAALAKRRAEDIGVTIEFGSPTTTPSCSGNRVLTFPTLTFPLTEEEAIKIRHSLIHEPLHVLRYKTFILLGKYPNLDDKCALLWNFVEDNTMEKLHAEKYAGDATDIGKGMNLLVRDRVNDLKAATIVEEDDIKTAAVMGLCIEARSSWDRLGTEHKIPFYNAIPLESKKLLAELVKEGWADKMDACTTEESVEKFTIDLYNRVFNRPLQTDNPTPKKKEVAADGSKEENDDNLKRVNWEDFKLTGDGIGGSALWIDWTGKNGEPKFTPHPDNKVIDLKKRGANYNNLYESHQEYIDTSTDSAILGNQIRKHLYTMTRKSLQTEKISGKLHKANLYRVAVPNVRGDWNKRIFKRRIDGLAIDTAVTVLVDWSGSMSGTKKKVAAQSAQRLLKVFDKALHIPVEVLAFGTKSATFNVGVVKAFNDKSYTQEDIAKRFRAMSSLASGNQDADAILVAQSRLRKRKEKRKILLVMSDGSPSAAWYCDADAGLRYVVNDIKKHTSTELYGIGIKDSSVKRFYGDNAKIVNNLEELNAVVLETIKRGVEHE